MRFVRFLTLFAAILIAHAAAADNTRTERVRFPTGQNGTTVSGKIRGYDTVNYIIGARAGQRMVVEMSTSNASAYFNIFAPGDVPGSSQAMFIASSSGLRYQGTLPESGDYLVQVYLYRNAARRNEQANYKLAVRIRGSGQSQTAAPQPDYADGLAGGPDYWAIYNLTSGDTLNVRTAPSTSARILIAFPNGTILKNLGCHMSGGQRWCKITQPGGTGVTGWVAGRYLREAAAPAYLNPPRDGSANDGSAARSPAEKACLDAVIRQTGTRDVRIMGSDYSEAATKVMLGVGPTRAPWSCLSSNGGIVQQIMSETNEGAL